MKSAFLALALTLASLSTHAATYNCVGTEPFWNLKVTDKTMTYSNPALESTMTLKVTSVADAVGFTPGFARIIRSKYTRLTLISGACNDGMSDDTFTHHAMFESAEGIFAGCCNAQE